MRCSNAARIFARKTKFPALAARVLAVEGEKLNSMMSRARFTTPLRQRFRIRHFEEIHRAAGKKIPGTVLCAALRDGGAAGL